MLFCNQVALIKCLRFSAGLWLNSVTACISERRNISIHPNAITKDKNGFFHPKTADNRWVSTFSPLPLLLIFHARKLSGAAFPANTSSINSPLLR